MIGRAWRFFTHPVARAGAILAIVLMAVQLWPDVQHAIELVMREPAYWPDGSPMRSRRLILLYGFLNTLVQGLFLLFFSIIAEYAARIARDVARIRALAASKRGEEG